MTIQFNVWLNKLHAQHFACGQSTKKGFLNFSMTFLNSWRAKNEFVLESKVATTTLSDWEEMRIGKKKIPFISLKIRFNFSGQPDNNITTRREQLCHFVGSIFFLLGSKNLLNYSTVVGKAGIFCSKTSWIKFDDTSVLGVRKCCSLFF